MNKQEFILEYVLGRARASTDEPHVDSVIAAASYAWASVERLVAAKPIDPTPRKRVMMGDQNE